MLWPSVWPDDPGRDSRCVSYASRPLNYIGTLGTQISTLASANFDAWAAAIGKCPTGMKRRSKKRDESLVCVMVEGFREGKAGTECRAVPQIHLFRPTTTNYAAPMDRRC